MNISQTPETDALWARYITCEIITTRDLFSFARKLETERDEARAQLQAEREFADRLAESLVALSKTCPTVGCEEMHHPKHYQHGDDDPCPPLRLYNEARRDAYHKIERWKEARKS